MSSLRILGSREEALLFRTLGIEAYAPGEPCALLLGGKAHAPDDVDVYVRLPDTEAPLGETERLAALLGGAVGQDSVRL